MEATTWVVILNSQLVLLGDSIIDNKTYVLDSESSVFEHIQSKTEINTLVNLLYEKLH